jgi:5'-nucleotidase
LGRQGVGASTAVLALIVSLAFSGCAGLPNPGGASKAPTSATATVTLTLFGLNDFHGHIQSAGPVPYVLNRPDPADPARRVAVPHGGYAHVRTLLEQLRAKAGTPTLTVGAGDLIGASPLGSSLLKDEPAIQVLNDLGLDVAVVGNHEFDAGQEELRRKMDGRCPAAGCALPGFSGAKFPYLGANVVDVRSGQPWLQPFVIRELQGVKIAFIGAVTRETPRIVMASGIQGLKFTDEAEAINAQIPKARAAGAQLFVALLHEGGVVRGQGPGAWGDPTYACPGLEGEIVDISRRLDRAVSVVFSGHTHQAYTCKRDGRLLVQAQSHGAMITEVTMKVNASTGDVQDAQAVNRGVEQALYPASPHARPLMDQVERLTGPIKNEVLAEIPEPITRRGQGPGGETPLGALIAEAQLAFARSRGSADVAFMNNGGVRADLPALAASSPVKVTRGDVFATQPFGNPLLTYTLTGAEILELLRSQWQGTEATQPRMLQSAGLSYRWDARLPLEQRLIDVRIGGQALDLGREYRVVSSAFLADGGDRYAVLARGRKRETLGLDIDALVEWLRQSGASARNRLPGRVLRLDP